MTRRVSKDGGNWPKWVGKEIIFSPVAVIFRGLQISAVRDAANVSMSNRIGSDCGAAAAN